MCAPCSAATSCSPATSPVRLSPACSTQATAIARSPSTARPPATAVRRAGRPDRRSGRTRRHAGDPAPPRPHARRGGAAPWQRARKPAGNTNRFIADRLARAVVVALIYDKRGSGGSGGSRGSGGDWKTADYEDLARDALAGIALLTNRADVDPARIGLHGHSSRDRAHQRCRAVLRRPARTWHARSYPRRRPATSPCLRVPGSDPLGSCRRLRDRGNHREPRCCRACGRAPLAACSDRLLSTRCGRCRRSGDRARQVR